MLPRLTTELRGFDPMAGVREVTANQRAFKGRHGLLVAGVDAKYVTDANIDQILRHYQSSIADQGWVIRADVYLPVGGPPTGERALEFCKDDMRAVLEYRPPEMRAGWVFALSVDWLSGRPCAE
ncbi:MAG TPA: hypothetical protein VFP65_02475 [Anaeromyxobacteraceae bacterium]|nr:hypothetical protein [Anaeromyxobacteraceae bacterium]